MLQTSVTESDADIQALYTRKRQIESELLRRSLVNHLDIPRVFLPFLKPIRYKGAYGGRGSGKSHAFAELLLGRCLREPGTRAVCVREFQTTLVDSVKRLLEDKIKAYQVDSYFRVMDSCIITPGDGIITFLGMRNHSTESIKSLERFNVAWVEEAQTLSKRSLQTLDPTFRVDGAELWFSWNPRDAKDPVDKLFRSGPLADSIVVRSTYADNPYLSDDLLKIIERDRLRDHEKYSHVWMGEYERHSESRVFKNWTIGNPEDHPQLFTPDPNTVFYYGGDWGYSVDPTVLVRMSVEGRTLYIYNEAYKVGCEIDNIPALFASVPGSAEWPIVADSARPETIAYLQRHGYPRLEAAKKGPNSVKEGIIFLQGFDIVVHPHCKQTIDELIMYSYKVDPLTDTVTPILEDKKNHVIDSLRYAVEKLNNPEEEEEVTWGRKVGNHG